MGTHHSKHTATPKQQQKQSRFAPDQLHMLQNAFNAMKGEDEHVNFDGFKKFFGLPSNLNAFAARLFRAIVPPDQHPELISSSKNKITKCTGHFSFKNFVDFLEIVYKPSSTTQALNYLGRVYAKPVPDVAVMSDSIPSANMIISQADLQSLFKDCIHLLHYCSEWEEVHCLPLDSNQHKDEAADIEPSELEKSRHSESSSSKNRKSQPAEEKHAEKTDENDAVRKMFTVNIPTHKNPSVNPMNELPPEPEHKPNPEDVNKRKQAEEKKLTKNIIAAMMASALDFGKESDFITVAHFEDWAIECAPGISNPFQSLLHLRFFQPPIPEASKKEYKPIAALPLPINMEKSQLWCAGMRWVLDLIFDDRRDSWRLLYNSVVHGHSLNRFIHHVVGYGGPTIMLIKDSEGRLFGAYMSQGTFHLHLHSAWSVTPQFIGDANSFLFAITPKLVVKRPCGPEKNYAYLYSKKNSYSHFTTGIGFGGTSPKFRLYIDEDLLQGECRASDTTYETGHVFFHLQLVILFNRFNSPLIPVSVFTPTLIEVWGCGGSAAELAQARANHLKALIIERSRKVNRAQAAAGWASGVDRYFCAFSFGGSLKPNKSTPHRAILDWMGKTTDHSEGYMEEVRAAAKKLQQSSNAQHDEM